VPAPKAVIDINFMIARPSSISKLYVLKVEHEPDVVVKVSGVGPLKTNRSSFFAKTKARWNRRPRADLRRIKQPPPGLRALISRPRAGNSARLQSYRLGSPVNDTSAWGSLRLFVNKLPGPDPSDRSMAQGAAPLVGFLLRKDTAIKET